ncbi:Uncharacterised protein [Mycobacteroides abscessus subsp. abscessus]|nr:Uncharacterised protein [Mycobacteroides abscessus subsp. abscessus]
MQERQLHGVTNLLDLPRQTADIAVADVRHLFEHKVLDLGLGDTFEGVPRFGVDQQRITRPQFARLEVCAVGVLGHLGEVRCDQRIGQPHDALFVRVPHHERAVAVIEYLAQGADFPHRLEVTGLHHGERLVETHGLATAQLAGLDVGRAGHPHLAPGSEHIDRLIGLHGQQHPVTARRLPQPVDLLA